MHITCLVISIRWKNIVPMKQIKKELHTPKNNDGNACTCYHYTTTVHTVYITSRYNKNNNIFMEL